MTPGSKRDGRRCVARGRGPCASTRGLGVANKSGASHLVARPRAGLYASGYFAKNIVWSASELALLFVFIVLFGVPPAVAGLVILLSLACRHSLTSAAARGFALKPFQFCFWRHIQVERISKSPGDIGFSGVCGEIELATSSLARQRWESASIGGKA